METHGHYAMSSEGSTEKGTKVVKMLSEGKTAEEMKVVAFGSISPKAWEE